MTLYAVYTVNGHKIALFVDRDDAVRFMEDIPNYKPKEYYIQEQYDSRF